MCTKRARQAIDHFETALKVNFGRIKVTLSTPSLERPCMASRQPAPHYGVYGYQNGMGEKREACHHPLLEKSTHTHTHTKTKIEISPGAPSWEGWVGGGEPKIQSFQPCKSRRLLAVCCQGCLEVTFIEFRKGNKKKPTKDSSPRVPRTLVPRRRSGKGPGNLFLISTATRGLLSFELAYISGLCNFFKLLLASQLSHPLSPAGATPSGANMSDTLAC